ncbi:hypothetical protein CANARDRAFT_174279 [[Candida] arabinofermentans NRRL YB-2248]|uniref:5-formyltetrahydrofolate cyclo-ligase n=1 Tax=[Candida] arabinofermentans NRRL YB-2248 TaxID=983967 RepID=A0A1E4T5Z9_9ASCO|nr:hypothetical protein CANARDRAFT_174279 [[Candida] arabinofermentans NRRL YB-2248]
MKQAKVDLRRTVKLILKGIPQENIKSQSDKLAKFIQTTTILKNAKTVGLYMCMPHSELQTDLLIIECIKQNKKVYLPRITPLTTFNELPRYPSQKTCLHFLRVENISTVETMAPRGRYSIREPEFEYADLMSNVPSNDLLLNRGKLDVLLVPGVAFTKTGGRLGHGVGFYDDFIKRYREVHQGEQPILVGIGLEEQLIENNMLVLEDHDEKLDYVIIGDRVYGEN